VRMEMEAERDRSGLRKCVRTKGGPTRTRTLTGAAHKGPPPAPPDLRGDRWRSTDQRLVENRRRQTPSPLGIEYDTYYVSSAILTTYQIRDSVTPAP
jgi:hypothetical protein